MWECVMSGVNEVQQRDRTREGHPAFPLLLTTTTTSSSGNAVLARPGPTPRTHALSPPASRRQSLYTIGEGTSIQLHWLFRSNIPRRRGMPMPADVRKRNFFGIGEIIGVLANVRSVCPISSCLSRWQRWCEHVH